MRIIIGLICAFAFAFPALAQNATAPVFCGEANSIEKGLLDKYQETPIWAGAGNQGVNAFLTQSGAGSWTFYIRMPNGGACIFASGNGGQTIDPAPPKPDGSAS